MKLYNTLSRKIEEFRPINDKKVGLYTCGPTVYDFAHIGNLRTFVFEDTLRRALEFEGYEVKQVMNITDVGHLTGDDDGGEDKIEKGAKREGKTASEIARYYEKIFLNDLKALNVELPEVMPRAAEHIEDQIEIIKQLEAGGYTYETSDGIYFDTSKAKDYGKLARLNIKGQKEGARVKKNDEKKNPSDFALWKFSPKDKKRHMEWPSPWGVGFPGWHIECSAMSVKYLGQPFDIHTGGIDHIPIHHTNEIAQSESAYGKPLANYWLHADFLNVDGRKMAKSRGDFYRIEDLNSRGYDPLDFRYFCLSAHYRSKLNFTWEALTAAKNSRMRLNNIVSSLESHSRPRISYGAGSDWESAILDPRVKPENDMTNTKYLNEFKEKVNNDLNMPEALAQVWEMMRDERVPAEEKYATILEMDKVLGLNLGAENKIEIPEEVKKLVSEREKARLEKDWTKSDELRKEIDELGFLVEDAASGSKVIKK